MKGNLDDTLESIRKFCDETGVKGAVELYTIIDAEVRRALDANQTVPLSSMVQMFQNVFIGFTSSLCAYFAAHVIDDKRDAFIEKYQERFMEGVRDCVPELVEGLLAKLKKENDDEHSENTGAGRLH